MIITPSYSFNRATGTTQYAATDLVANSATAGSVVPLSWSLQRILGHGIIVGARLKKSDKSTTSAKFDLYLFSADPGTPANGDNGTFGVASSADFIDIISFDLTTGALAGGTSYVAGRAECEIGVDFSADAPTLYGLLVAADTYTPASAETFVVQLEIMG